MLKLLLSLLVFIGFLFCNLNYSLAGEHKKRENKREHYDDDDNRDREHKKETTKISQKQLKEYIKKNFATYTDDFDKLAQEKREDYQDFLEEIYDIIEEAISNLNSPELPQTEKDEAIRDCKIHVLEYMSKYFAMKASLTENKKTANAYIDKMNSVLETVFNTNAEAYSSRIKNMEKETAELKKILAKRKLAKKEIIKARREQLLSEFSKYKSWYW